MDVDFFEMHGIGVEYLDMRKADRNVIGDRDHSGCASSGFRGGGFARTDSGACPASSLCSCSSSP